MEINKENQDESVLFKKYGVKPLIIRFKKLETNLEMEISDKHTGEYVQNADKIELEAIIGNGKNGQ